MNEHLPTDHLPSADEMQRVAGGMIESAVAEQLPSFVSTLVEGMMAEVEDPLKQRQITPDEVKAMAHAHIEKYVGVFSAEAVRAAQDEMDRRIDKVAASRE